MSTDPNPKSKDTPALVVCGEARFSTNFHVFCGGARLQQTVRSDGDPAEHVALLQATMAALEGAGFSARDPDQPVNPDEMVVVVVGYIYGQYSNGPCVWLYTEKSKYAQVVYDDHFDKLWFRPVTTNQYPVPQAPEKDMAISRPEYHKIPPRRVVLVARKKADGSYDLSQTGKKRWTYDHPEGVSNAPSGQADPPAASTNGKSPQQKMVDYFRDASTPLTKDQFVAAATRANAARSTTPDWSQVEQAMRFRLALMDNTLPRGDVHMAALLVRDFLSEAVWVDVAGALGLSLQGVTDEVQ